MENKNQFGKTKLLQKNSKFISVASLIWVFTVKVFQVDLKGNKSMFELWPFILNTWKAMHCQKCSFETGGSHVPKPRKHKFHVCLVIVDSEDMKIFSDDLSYRHNRVFVAQDGAHFVCHSDKCKEKRTVHMASEATFAWDHTKLIKSHSYPS